jgi:hypothetical protein
MSMPEGARSARSRTVRQSSLTIRAALAPVYRTFTLKAGREYEARYLAGADAAPDQRAAAGCTQAHQSISALLTGQRNAIVFFL